MTGRPINCTPQEAARGALDMLITADRSLPARRVWVSTLEAKSLRPGVSEALYGCTQKQLNARVKAVERAHRRMGQGEKP